MGKKDNSLGGGPIGGMDEDNADGRPAFDIGFEPFYRGRLEPPIMRAQEFAAEMRGKLADQLTRQVAESAVVADGLAQKVAAQLAAPVQAAAETHGELSQRLASTLMQPLFDAAAWGEQWGLFPTVEPGMIPPAQVLEARAMFGLEELGIPPAPDGRPLVIDRTTFDSTWREFGEDVLPLRSVDFDRYVGRLREIEARFPPGSSYAKEFRSRLATAEAETPIGIRPAEVSLTLADSTAGQAPPASSGGEPGTVSGGAFVDVRPPTKPTIPGLIPPPVTRPPTRPIPPGMGGPPAPPVAIGDVPVWDPLDPAGPCYVVLGPAFSKSGFLECAPGSQVVNILPGRDPRYINGGLYCVQVGPCPPGAPPTLTPPSPGTAPPSGVSPAPPPAGPCVSICGMDDLISALKGDGKECGKWKAWRDAESGECYVQPADKEPRNSVDEFLIESADAAAIVAAVQDKCGPEKPRPPERPEVPELPAARPVEGCDWILPVQIDGGLQVANWLGFLSGSTELDGTLRQNSITDAKGWFWGPLVRFYTSFWKTVGDKMQQLVQAAIRSNPCISGANVSLIFARAVVNFVGLFVGDSLSQVKTPLTQHSNFLCPVGMPDYSQATAAWLRNAISAETRDCWVRACGMRPELWNIVAESQRSRFTPDQLVRLLFRKEITPQEFAVQIRELGYIREDDAAKWAKLGTQIPGPADLVRFMLRDVADPNIVERFGLDDSFKDKFQGDLVRQAEAQGLTPETMRDYWRAHWSIPSPSQLYEMYHRLRNRPAGDPLQVSLDDVRTALEQADILPYWIPKLLEVSFRPLRLVDTRRAYFNGSIDRQEVQRTYEAVGYSDRDAGILVEFQEKDKADSFVRGPHGKRFMAGAINGQSLTQKMGELGFGPNEQAYIRGELVRLMEANRTQKCAANVRRRQMRGEVDKLEAATLLQDLGLDGDQAILLTEAWACERATRGKEFSGSQLCKLYSEGLITGPEFVRRLEVVGWSRDDAVKLYETCSRDLERKRRAEEIRILRQQEAEKEKAARSAAAAAKQLKREAEEEQAQRDRLAKLNQQRNKVLTDAGANWAKRFDGDLSEAIQAARRTYQAISRTTTLPKDSIIKAVHVASRAPSVENEDQWLTEALTVAQGQVDTINGTGTKV